MSLTARRLLHSRQVRVRLQYLAAARPDAFLPDLAASLNNQSSRPADLGRREEALAAIGKPSPSAAI